MTWDRIENVVFMVRGPAFEDLDLEPWRNFDDLTAELFRPAAIDYFSVLTSERRLPSYVEGAPLVGPSGPGLFEGADGLL